MGVPTSCGAAAKKYMRLCALPVSMTAGHGSAPGESLRPSVGQAVRSCARACRSGRDAPCRAMAWAASDDDGWVSASATASQMEPSRRLRREANAAATAASAVAEPARVWADGVSDLRHEHHGGTPVWPPASCPGDDVDAIDLAARVFGLADERRDQTLCFEQQHDVGGGRPRRWRAA
jgi:hypothetical protein